MDFLPFPTRQHRRLMLGVALWVVGAGVGFAVLNEYANTPGPEGEAPLAWPAESRLHLRPELPTLLVFMHPQCPCSNATLEELARLLAFHHSLLQAEVVFVRAPGLEDAEMQGDLWEQAKRLPGVAVSIDENGREAQLFGATTSGSTLLFDPAGRQLFHGGITAARGHAGDNPGRNAIAAAVEGVEPQTRVTPVFGCSLLGDGSVCEDGPCHE